MKTIVTLSIRLDGVVWVASPSGCRLVNTASDNRPADTEKMWHHNLAQMMDYLVWCLCLKGLLSSSLKAQSVLTDEKEIPISRYFPHRNY